MLVSVRSIVDVLPNDKRVKQSYQNTSYRQRAVVTVMLGVVHKGRPQRGEGVVKSGRLRRWGRGFGGNADVRKIMGFFTKFDINLDKNC